MKPLAVFTLVQNEDFFLEHWLRYYAGQVPLEDIYVLDHESGGNSADVMEELFTTTYRGVHMLPVNHNYAFDGYWMAQLTRHFQHVLLHSYRSVLFVAADEIVTARGKTLLEYAETMTDYKACRIQGYEVVHKKDEEPAVDPFAGNLLLQNRKYWYPCRRYTKPLLANFQVNWLPGWFSATNVPDTQEPDPNLLLIHLHRVDHDMCLASHREKAARQWNPEDRQGGFYRHNLVEDVEQFGNWMLCNADKTRELAVLETIPDEMKEIV